MIPAGTRPSDVAVADLNGDGIPDLIVSNYAADTIWVMLGNGNGTFGPPTIYPTDQGPGFAGPGGRGGRRLTGDGIPDLIYADYVSGNVAVRLGNGNGTFGPEDDLPAAAGSHAVAVADLTGDGKPDLVVVNAVANSVSVLMGNGNGTFQPQKVYPVGIESVYAGDRGLQRRRHARHRHVQPRRQYRERASGQRRRHVRAPGDVSRPEQPAHGRGRRISMATATLTSSPPIWATTRRACSWAEATAHFRSARRQAAPRPPAPRFRWWWPT